MGQQATVLPVTADVQSGTALTFGRLVLAIVLGNLLTGLIIGFLALVVSGWKPS
jgi:hypothetical protein